MFYGKEDSIATVQIDILVPERMGITYVDAEGNKQYPVVIHKSIMGAFERFMGFLIEQTGGWFPFWLAPEQVRILTINDTVLDYVDEIKAILSEVVLMKPVNITKCDLLRTVETKAWQKNSRSYVYESARTIDRRAERQRNPRSKRPHTRR